MDWNHIYSYFNPVAFEVFSFKVHWYGIMYALALLSSLIFAKWLVKRDNLKISEKMLDSYFVWVEIGVIVGARIGYIAFYDPHSWYYFTHPWQIFNPFVNGEFVGIRGMSYHGAIIGFLIANYFFAKRHKFNSYFLLDLTAISVPLGYVFGRIGNFLNQELIGRETDMPWGIYVDNILRHPSQLYEALTEGFIVFVILFIYRKRKKFEGELMAIYAILYAIMRSISEIYRAPDIQLGFLWGDFLTMGQLLSSFMFVYGMFILYRGYSKRV